MSHNDPPYTPSNTQHLARLLTSATVLPDTNPASLYLASLSEQSQRTMRTALNGLAGLLGIPEHRNEQGQDMRYLDAPWASLRREHTTALYAALQERYAPATANKLLAALRRVLREARHLGQMSAEDYNQAIELPALKIQRQPKSRLLTEREFAALMRACAEDSSPAGVRDAAILALLRGTGLLRSEAVALNLTDVDSENGAVTVRTVRNRPHRVVYVPEGTQAALRDWMATRGDAPGPLFYGVVKGGALVPRRLAGQALAVICASRGADARVAPFTPRDLRNSFITGLLEAGADVVTAQQLVGHEELSTTLRYDRRGEAAMRRAIALIHVPYVPRNR